jgi:hypothetical protein
MCSASSTMRRTMSREQVIAFPPGGIAPDCRRGLVRILLDECIGAFAAELVGHDVSTVPQM